MAEKVRARGSRAGGFRLLGLTWLGIAGLVAAGIAVLAILGPPKHRHGEVRVVARVAGGAPPVHAAAVARPSPGLRKPAAPPPDLSLAPLDDALSEPAPVSLGGTLPAIAADGRRSSTVYAARVPHVLAGQSRLALVLDGVGLDEAESRRAAAELAPAITLALSPYGEHLAPIAAAARRAGHEILVSIPMEPEGSPVTDEGDRQLRPDAAPNENALNLDWALSRVAGIVGATGAEAGQNGAHVANAPDVLGTVTTEAAARGLIYLEPNPGHPLPPGTDGLVADIVIDTRDAVSTATDLAALADAAIRQGHAVGIVGPLTDRTLLSVEAWSRTLPASGIVLVPASSLAGVAPPAAEAGVATAP